MNLRLLRAVAIIDAVNVGALALVSPPHGLAGAAGYAPALAATVLVHLAPRRTGAARLLCWVGLVPNTVLAVRAAGASRRSRALSAYVAIGGALLGIGYLVALDGDRREKA